MGQESAEIWTAQTDSQPGQPKSDRLLATVLQWLVLSILTGAVVGTGCSCGQRPARPNALEDILGEAARRADHTGLRRFSWQGRRLFPAGRDTELLFLKTVMIGILCGVVAWIFVELLHGMRRQFTRLRLRFTIWPPLHPCIGGVVLALLLLVIPTDYMGLSLPLMDHALQGQPMP